MAAYAGTSLRRPTTVAPARARVHRLGTALLVVGLVALAWAFVVWKWNDPVSGLYTRYEQHRLSTRLEAVVANTAPVAPTHDGVAAAARRFRRIVHAGDPIGRLTITRLGASFVVVEGTDAASLRRGPGRDARSSMPGEGHLVYIAGHRTTYAAPFAHIDALRAGDTIVLATPYATFVYAVTGHSIVASGDLTVLRPRRTEVLALQACHPRFFATHRYIVWARLRTVATARGALARARTPG